MFNVNNLTECRVLDIVSRQAGIKPVKALRHRSNGLYNKAQAGATIDNDFYRFTNGSNWSGGPALLGINQPLFFGNVSFQYLGNATPQTAPYTHLIYGLVIDTNDGQVYDGATTQTILEAYGDTTKALPLSSIIHRLSYFDSGIQVLTPWLRFYLLTQAATNISFTVNIWFEGWQVFTN